MSSNRQQRTNEDIQRALSSLLRSVKDPRLQGMLSITEVQATKDLRYCKVYVSSLEKGNDKEILKGLRSASGYLRRELASSLSLRYTPELIFELDSSIERGAEITKLINSLGIEKNGDEESGD